MLSIPAQQIQRHAITGRVRPAALPGALTRPGPKPREGLRSSSKKASMSALGGQRVSEVEGALGDISRVVPQHERLVSLIGHAMMLLGAEFVVA